MPHSSDHPLVKQIHDNEREIEALECKIQFADLKTTYPHEYGAIRSEQELRRQDILKCKSEIDESLHQAACDNEPS